MTEPSVDLHQNDTTDCEALIHSSKPKQYSINIDTDKNINRIHSNIYNKSNHFPTMYKFYSNEDFHFRERFFSCSHWNW